MIQDWRLLVEDAESLFSHEMSAARARSAISRLYYAAYHASLQLAEGNGYQFDVRITHGVHRQLSDYLTTSGNSRLRRVGVRLRDFHRLRIDADYKLHMIISRHHAEDALELMSEIIEAIPSAAP